ncbi:hypothetical protein M407DRAFT_159519 [Tulasnella calospora MUT 4182]|uniref:Uncharacterized protein n=1 Tax=Tulasnella calospora MUT 4182 TaxID=1051891 RepID=A0A0C3L828_9AGAM|nr:hypothetical protein M407DRAFT_159519 [Tulasnella calospora MUT 4182]
MKQSAKAAKDQMEAVDRKVSQISGKLDPALADLTEEVKRLQVDLVDEFDAERTRFETKIKGLEAEVKELGEEGKELKKEARVLQQVIRDTRAELLPVKVALEARSATNQNKQATAGRPTISYKRPRKYEPIRWV